MQELAPTDVVGNRACNRAMSSTGLKVNQKMICAIDQNSGVCNVSMRFFFFTRSALGVVEITSGSSFSLNPL